MENNHFSDISDFVVINQEDNGIITIKTSSPHGFRNKEIEILDNRKHTEEDIRPNHFTFLFENTFFYGKILSVLDDFILRVKESNPHLYLYTDYHSIQINLFKFGSSSWGNLTIENGKVYSSRIQDQQSSGVSHRLEPIKIWEVPVNFTGGCLLKLERKIQSALKTAGYKKDPRIHGKEWFGTHDEENPCQNEIINIIEKILNSENIQIKKPSGIKLHSHQKRIVKAQEKNHTQRLQILLAVPRSGKNHIAIERAYRFYKRRFYEYSNLVLVVTPLIALCNSFRSDLASRGEGTSNILEVNASGGSHREIELFIKRNKDIDKPLFVVTTVQNFLQNRNVFESFKWADLFIDEFHIYCNHEHELPKFGRFLQGLVQKRNNISEYVYVYTGSSYDRPSIVSKEHGLYTDDLYLIENYRYEDAAKDGILSPFSILVLEVPDSDTLLYNHRGSVNIEGSRTKLKWEVVLKTLVRRIVAGESKKILIRVRNTTSQKRALQKIQEGLEKFGIRGVTYHELNSSTGKDERDFIFRGDNSEIEITVVINVGKIGSTYPNHDTAIILDQFPADNKKGQNQIEQFYFRILGNLGTTIPKTIIIPLIINNPSEDDRNCVAYQLMSKYTTSIHSFPVNILDTAEDPQEGTLNLPQLPYSGPSRRSFEPKPVPNFGSLDNYSAIFSQVATNITAEIPKVRSFDSNLELNKKKSILIDHITKAEECNYKGQGRNWWKKSLEVSQECLDYIQIKELPASNIDFFKDKREMIENRLRYYDWRSNQQPHLEKRKKEYLEAISLPATLKNLNNLLKILSKIKKSLNFCPGMDKDLFFNLNDETKKIKELILSPAVPAYIPKSLQRIEMKDEILYLISHFIKCTLIVEKNFFQNRMSIQLSGIGPIDVWYPTAKHTNGYDYRLDEKTFIRKNVLDLKRMIGGNAMKYIDELVDMKFIERVCSCRPCAYRISDTYRSEILNDDLFLTHIKAGSSFSSRYLLFKYPKLKHVTELEHLEFIPRYLQHSEFIPKNLRLDINWLP
jgi:superfamily II DNA or RNA helicase